MDRKLFALKGFHHPGGSQAAFLTGLVHLYNLIPYQQRAKNAGLCGIGVAGRRVPTTDWMLNLQILTSGLTITHNFRELRERPKRQVVDNKKGVADNML